MSFAFHFCIVLPSEKNFHTGLRFCLFFFFLLLVSLTALFPQISKYWELNQFLLFLIKNNLVMNFILLFFCTLDDLIYLCNRHLGK